MKTLKITNLQQPQSLDGLSSSNDQNQQHSLTLESIALQDGKEVKVNVPFTPSMEGQGNNELVAKFNHEGRDYQFVVDSNRRVQARNLPSDSPITGATISSA